MTSELAVWLFADRIGTLSLDRGAVGFSYLDSWLQREDSMALSISLPLQSQPFTDAQARPFFSGLLPEGRVRQLLSKQFQISTLNDFALLDYIGGECAGAITLLESGGVAPAPLPADFTDVQWLTDTQLDSILDELPRRPMMAGIGEYRLSLAGAQDKLPVVFDGAKIGLPANGRPSTHIMKPAISEVQGSVVNEAFCMALAALTGISTAPTMIRRVKDKEYLLVERYDRIGESDQPFKLHRLHQEDFCQALAVVPEMKYQNEGGPDFKQCFALLRQVTRPSAPQILSMLDQVFFNTLIGNNDAHSKNFSLLYTDNKPVLAPTSVTRSG